MTELLSGMILFSQNSQIAFCFKEEAADSLQTAASFFFLQSPFKFQQQNSQVAFCFRSDDEATDSLQAAASSFAQSLQFPAAQMDVISAFLTLTVS